jgi:hypothetical protein
LGALADFVQYAGNPHRGQRGHVVMTAMMTNIPTMRVQPSAKKTTPIIAMTASVQVSQVVMYVLMIVPPNASTAWSCFRPAALSRHN